MHNDANSERRPLVDESKQPIHVYARRWWVLAVFCFTCTTQALFWNTWGPIAQSAELVFGWSDGMVALLPNLWNISYLVFVIPGSILMDTKGLRVSMILCSSVLVFCTAIRCITLEPVVFTTLAYVGSAVQAMAGIVTFCGPPLISAVWFPVYERPTSTAIASFFAYFGLSLAFIVGPQLVPGPIYQTTPSRPMSNYSGNSTNDLDIVSNFNELENGISYLMFVQLGAAILLFVLVLIYFPAKPPRPPSITASIERTDYKHVIQKVLRNGPLWLISLSGSMQIGVCGCWIAVIDVIIKDIGVSQVDAGWMGFFNSAIGCSAGIVIAKCSSYVHGRRKILLISFLTCAGICSLWFSLICDSVLAFSLPSLYISCILMGIFVNGTVPLFYEMAVEASYPVGEGVTGGFFTTISTIAGIVFLALVGIPNIGITWINWTVLGSLCISIILLLVFPERYKRSDIDMNIDRDL